MSFRAGSAFPNGGKRLKFAIPSRDSEGPRFVYEFGKGSVANMHEEQSEKNKNTIEQSQTDQELTQGPQPRRLMTEDVWGDLSEAFPP
jgi:hypothetical protein